MTQLPAAAHAPSGPVLSLTPYGNFGGSDFHLAGARIAWPTGAVSEGWGRDPDPALAQRKATAEAVERQAYRQLPRTARQARGSELTAVLEPEALVRYAPDSEAGSRLASYDPHELRWWLPALPVQGGARVHALADFVCGPGAFEPEYRAKLLARATTSGCASGSSIDQAILGGTLELVERDAFMRHWFAQEPGDTLLRASLPAWCAGRLDALHAQGCHAGVQCLTRGRHPVFLAWARHDRLHFTCCGAAAGLDGEQALHGAMNEMETLAWVRLGTDSAPAIEPDNVDTPADHGALYATASYFGRADAMLRPHGYVRFADAAHACACPPAILYDRLRARGHGPCWVDLTLADACNALEGRPLYTVRVLAPGLVPIAFGLRWQAFGMLPVAEGGRFPHPFH